MKKILFRGISHKYFNLSFSITKKNLNIALHNKKIFRSYSPFSEKETLSKVKDFFVLIVIYLIGGQEHTLG